MRQIRDEEQQLRQRWRMRRSAYVLLNSRGVRLFTTAGGGGRFWLTHTLGRARSHSQDESAQSEVGLCN